MDSYLHSLNLSLLYINIQKVKVKFIKLFFFSLPMKEVDIVKKLILQKLVRGNLWGGKHTPINFIFNGIPENYKNTHKGKKVVEKVLKELKNDGWIIILTKKTGKGSDNHLSLNPRKIGEIKQFLQKVIS